MLKKNCLNRNKTMSSCFKLLTLLIKFLLVTVSKKVNEPD